MQEEIHRVFDYKGLSKYFNGIYGSPKDKNELISDMVKNKELVLPAIFIGDSRYDYETALNNDLDFIFISRYTEFKDWRSYFEDIKGIKVINDLSYLGC